MERLARFDMDDKTNYDPYFACFKARVQQLHSQLFKLSLEKERMKNEQQEKIIKELQMTIGALEGKCKELERLLVNLREKLKKTQIQNQNQTPLPSKKIDQINLNQQIPIQKKSSPPKQIQTTNSNEDIPGKTTKDSTQDNGRSMTPNSYSWSQNNSSKINGFNFNQSITSNQDSEGSTPSHSNKGTPQNEEVPFSQINQLSQINQIFKINKNFSKENKTPIPNSQISNPPPKPSIDHHQQANSSSLKTLIIKNNSEKSRNQSIDNSRSKIKPNTHSGIQNCEESKPKKEETRRTIKLTRNKSRKKIPPRNDISKQLEKNFVPILSQNRKTVQMKNISIRKGKPTEKTLKNNHFSKTSSKEDSIQFNSELEELSHSNANSKSTLMEENDRIEIQNEISSHYSKSKNNKSESQSSFGSSNAETKQTSSPEPEERKSIKKNFSNKDLHHGIDLSKLGEKGEEEAPISQRSNQNEIIIEENDTKPQVNNSINEEPKDTRDLKEEEINQFQKEEDQMEQSTSNPEFDNFAEIIDNIFSKERNIQIREIINTQPKLENEFTNQIGKIQQINDSPTSPSQDLKSFSSSEEKDDSSLSTIERHNEEKKFEPMIDSRNKTDEALLNKLTSFLSESPISEESFDDSIQEIGFSAFDNSQSQIPHKSGSNTETEIDLKDERDDLIHKKRAERLQSFGNPEFVPLPNEKNSILTYDNHLPQNKGYSYLNKRKRQQKKLRKEKSSPDTTTLKLSLGKISLKQNPGSQKNIIKVESPKSAQKVILLPRIQKKTKSNDMENKVDQRIKSILHGALNLSPRRPKNDSENDNLQDLNINTDLPLNEAIDPSSSTSTPQFGDQNCRNSKFIFPKTIS